jgi:hypothetical protein
MTQGAHRAMSPDDRDVGDVQRQSEPRRRLRVGRLMSAGEAQRFGEDGPAGGGMGGVQLIGGLAKCEHAPE